MTLPANHAGAQSKPSGSSSPPKALIVLKARDSAVTPKRNGYSTTGGGTVTVTQPTPDTLVISMTGVAATGSCSCEESQACLNFLLHQEFDIEFAKGGPQSGQIVLDARAFGQLRSEGRMGGTAAMTKAFVSVGCGEEVASVSLDSKSAGCGNSLAVTTVRGPVSAPVVAGSYHLHQEFGIAVRQPKCLVPKKTSADFAPPPTLDTRWIGSPDPFRETNRSNNGFLVTIRLIPDPPASGGTEKAPPPAPAPTEASRKGFEKATAQRAN